MSDHKFAVGDRVLVMAAPPDVQESHNATTGGRGADLWHDLPGTVQHLITADEYVQGGYDDPENPLYRVLLDTDLTEASNHGWISNHYAIRESDLIPERVPDEDLAEALASIQSAAARKNER